MRPILMRMSGLAALWGLALWLACCTASVLSAQERRVALVIGNSDYVHVPQLVNPANDADDIARTLRQMDFVVTLRHDLDDRGMRLALRDFRAVAEGADVALIYYAGHGVQIDNTNFMIPVNAELQRDADVEFEAIQLETMLQAVEPAGGLRIVLVDACRNNPFLVGMRRSVASRSLGRGLGKVEIDGVVVGFAARDGTVALDGTGRNSPYARALLDHLGEPGLELGKLFRKVRDAVLNATGGAQEPFFYGSLPAEDIFLVPPEPTLAMQTIDVDPSIFGDFAEADRTDTPEGWAAFLERQGRVRDNPLVRLAGQRLAALHVPEAAEPGVSVEAPTAVPEAEPPVKLNRSPPAWLTAPLRPDGTYELDLDSRRAVQRALNMAGYATGGIDGQFGPMTRRAITAIRAEAGLPPGSRIDPELIAVLPDPVATEALQSDRARAHDPRALSPGVEPRLAQAIGTLGDRPITFGYHDGHLYIAVLDRRSWASASSRARLMGGHLVTLGDLAEDRFVYRLIFRDPRFGPVDGTGAMHGPHIGLLRSSAGRGWGWMTQEPLAYDNWARGQPGAGDYGAYMRPANRRNAVSGPRYWTATPGGARSGYIVEID